MLSSKIRCLLVFSSHPTAIHWRPNYILKPFNNNSQKKVQHPKHLILSLVNRRILPTTTPTRSLSRAPTTANDPREPPAQSAALRPSKPGSLTIAGMIRRVYRQTWNSSRCVEPWISVPDIQRGHRRARSDQGIRLCPEGWCSCCWCPKRRSRVAKEDIHVFQTNATRFGVYEIH